jgi:hypothetical protein
MSDVATYVINSKSGITGSGTVNKFPIFTASTVVGDSIITQAALGQGITVGGNLDVTNDTNLQGSLLADSLEVTNDSVFIGSARFNGTIKDTSGGVGTNGQVLTSTGTGVAWATDAGGSVTGTGTTNYIAKWNTSSSIQDSIIFDNGTNVGVGTATPSAKLHVNGSEFLVTQGNETGLNINNDTYIYKIGDISGGENQAYMQIDSAASKAFFLNSNVGIGTSSPLSKLHLNGGTGGLFTGLTFGDGDTGIWEATDDNLRFSTSSSTRMIITNTGNVGIGTTSPVSIGGHSGVLTLYGSNATALALKDAVSEGHLRFDDSNFKFTNSGGNVRMQIEADTGNVGIGTTSPSQKLEISEGYISSSGAGTSHGFELKRSGLDTYRLRHLDSGLTVFNDTDGRKEMTFDGTGNVGVGTSSPASKLTVTGGDAEVTGSDKGLILESPNGTRYRIQVDNSGNLTTTAV